MLVCPQVVGLNTLILNLVSLSLLKDYVVLHIIRFVIYVRDNSQFSYSYLSIVL